MPALYRAASDRATPRTHIPRPARAKPGGDGSSFGRQGGRHTGLPVNFVRAFI